MWIVSLTPNPNGSYNDHRADHITSVPEGWAMIEEGFAVPDTFPFLKDIKAAKKTFYNEVDVPATREVPVLDDEGNPVLDEAGNPVTETENYMDKKQVPITHMVVTETTPGIVPEPVPEPPAPPTTEEGIAALEDALCEMDAANAASIAALEDALCEMDMGGTENE